MSTTPATAAVLLVEVAKRAFAGGVAVGEADEWR